MKKEPIQCCVPGMLLHPHHQHRYLQALLNKLNSLQPTGVVLVMVSGLGLIVQDHNRCMCMVRPFATVTGLEIAFALSKSA